MQNQVIDRCWLLLAFCVFACLISTQVCAFQRFDLQGVLGTSLQLDVYGVSEKRARAAFEQLKAHSKSLEGELSSWQQHSAVSRLNQQGRLRQPPQTLLDVIDLCQHWHRKSQGYFSCRLGKLRQKWREAEQQQTLPDRVALRYLARDIQTLQQGVVQQARQLILAKDVMFDIAGVAKGYIIDQLMLVVRKHLPEATGIKLDIGGDILFWGVPKEKGYWQVRLPDDNPQFSRQVQIPAMAIASSGHNSRYYQIGGRRFSHILQPRQGWPMFEAPSAVVLAADAASADAVATALCTQDVAQGIDWVNQLPGVEAQVSVNGLTLSSAGWHQFSYTAQPGFASHTLIVDYQIPKINSEKYYRPYVSIWISDVKNRAVKQLLLLGESERWSKENRTWWRKVGRKKPALVDALARPTRRPGHYRLSWYGLDDQGQAIAAGDYLLHMEAAREDGGHDYRKVALVWGSAPQTIDLAGSGELGKTRIELKSSKRLTGNTNRH